jgi:hypothetical protein
VAVGVGVLVGVGVWVGVGVGVPVAVGTGVYVAVGIGVSLGRGVAVNGGVGVEVGVGVGVGVVELVGVNVFVLVAVGVPVEAAVGVDVGISNSSTNCWPETIVLPPRRILLATSCPLMTPADLPERKACGAMMRAAMFARAPKLTREPATLITKSWGLVPVPVGPTMT